MKTRRSSPPHTGLYAHLSGLVLGLGLSLLTLAALPWQATWAANETTDAASAPPQDNVAVDGRRPYVLGDTLPKATPAKPSLDPGKDTHQDKGRANDTRGGNEQNTITTQDEGSSNTGKRSTDSTDGGNDRSHPSLRAGEKTASDADTANYQPMDWEALIPPDWEPLKDFQTLDFSSMADNDPRAIAALRKLQAAWKNAPLHPDIQHERIEISGFIIPLDSSTPGSIEELLLVPYFGACIHVPPPPANQIIHVVLDGPLKGFQMMDPVTVRGELRPSRHDTPFGSAGYQLSARQVSAYEEPAEVPLEEHP